MHSAPWVLPIDELHDEELLVDVPRGAIPGATTLTISTPKGAKVAVNVPDGAVPGTVLKLVPGSKSRSPKPSPPPPKQTEKSRDELPPRRGTLKKQISGEIKARMSPFRGEDKSAIKRAASLPAPKQAIPPPPPPPPRGFSNLSGFFKSQPPPVDATAQPGQGVVRVHLLRGTDLNAMDMNGSSDPYIVLKLAGIEHRSKTVEKMLNPKWDERFEFWGTLNKLLAFPLELECYDEDFLKKDDFLGSASVDLRPLLASAADEIRRFDVPLSIVRGGSAGEVALARRLSRGEVALAVSWEEGADPPPPEKTQIGRASCRERV